MRAQDEFYVLQAEGSVGGVLSAYPEIVQDLPCALLTSVDSLRDLSKWKMPEAIARSAKVIEKSLWVWTPALVEAARSDIFFGFEEVWFLEEPPAEPPPPGAWLVGPREILNDDIREAIAWMRRNGAELAMGDGTGLNVISRDRQRALKIAHRAPVS